MGLLHVCSLSLMVLISCVPYLSAETCEEKESSQLKLDVLRKSISDAKSLYPKCNDATDESNCTEKDKSLAHLNLALDLISVTNLTCGPCPEPKVIVLHERPMDCSDVQASGHNQSGVYPVWPRGRNIQSNQSINVFCDMETDGGGWTVIQRRGNFTNQTDFFQDWETYKKGFGKDLREDFWLGNEKIFILSNQGVYSARFDLVGSRGEYRYAAYNSFFIGDEYSGYVLHIQNHTGNASDGMYMNNGYRFSTKDRKNDGMKYDCPIMQKSAFWYGPGCGYVNVNGIFQPGVQDKKIVHWYEWNDQEGLFSVEIKIRRKYT